MSNAMRPEDELRPADEGGLAAPPVPAEGEARAAVTGGFDVGAAAAAVAAAAAQPLAQERAWLSGAPAGSTAPPDAAVLPALADAAGAEIEPPADPASGDAVDPATGWAIEPSSGWLIEPTTGYLLDPASGYYVEPTTGYYVDPSTGYLLDPTTGYPLDPATGCPFDPATGLPIDVAAYQEAASAAAPAEALTGDGLVEAPEDAAPAGAAEVRGEGDAPGTLEIDLEAAARDVAAPASADAAELPADAAADRAIGPVADAADAEPLPSSAGFAPADVPVDLAPPLADEGPAPAIADEPAPALDVAPSFDLRDAGEPPPPGDLFADLSAADALSFADDAAPAGGATAAAEASPLDEVPPISFVDIEAEPADPSGDAASLVGPPLDLWEALAPAQDAAVDLGEAPADPVAPADPPAPFAAPAQDDGRTTMWDLGATAPGAGGGEPGAWPGPEDAARLDDVALASSGSFDLAPDATFAAAAEQPQAADLPAFDLAEDVGLAPGQAGVGPVAPDVGWAPDDPAPAFGATAPGAADSAWAGQVAVPPGESGIDFSALESPAAAPQEVDAGEVEVAEAEILDVAEEDIVEIGDDVVALDEVELSSAPEVEGMAAPAIELPLGPALEDEAPAAEATVELAELPEATATAAAPVDDTRPVDAAVPPPALAEPRSAEPVLTIAAPEIAEAPPAPAVLLAAAAEVAAAPEIAAQPEPEPEPVLAPPRPAPAVIALGPVEDPPPPPPTSARSPFDPFSDLPAVPTLTAAPPPAPPAAEVAQAALPPPAPSAEPDAFVCGKHRVVVHTADGQVKRGALADAALDGPEIVIDAAGSGREAIASNRIKAIFFMLPTGETPPSPEGRRVRVTFRDGRQVAGFSRDYAPERTGFFMVPADTRTHTARIWVYQSAVRQVSVT